MHIQPRLPTELREIGCGSLLHLYDYAKSTFDDTPVTTGCVIGVQLMDNWISFPYEMKMLLNKLLESTTTPEFVATHCFTASAGTRIEGKIAVGDPLCVSFFDLMKRIAEYTIQTRNELQYMCQ